MQPLPRFARLIRPTFAATLVAALGLAPGCSDPAAPPADLGPDAGELTDAPPAATGFRVSTIGERHPVLPGTAIEIEIRVDRAEGFDGAVAVTVDHLPAGVSAEPLTVTAGSPSGTLTLRAAEEAAHSLPTAVGLRGAAGELSDVTAFVVTVIGAPGALDTSFAGGKVALPAGASDDYAFAAAVQPDGKIVVAGRAAEHLGDFALVRLDRDGQLDATFGTGGRVLTDFAGGGETIHAIALQPDGKIVAAGTSTVAGSSNDFALARYLADGRLDPSFGTGGKVTTAIGADSDTAFAVVLQPDGKIVVGGDSNRGSNQTGVDFAVARYTAAGALDAGFGAGGVALTSIATFGGRDSIYALALQTIDGEHRIVAAGGEGDFTVARYRANGQLDASFGTGGKVANLFGSTIGAARALAIGPGNAITIAGHSHHDVALARLTVDGALHPNFGPSGTVVTRLSATNWDEAQGLLLDDEGRLVVAGWVFHGNSSAGNFAVLRYLGDGRLDPSFGGTGMVVTPVAPGIKADQAMAVAFQRDERVPTTRIVAAGWASDQNSDVAVIRHWQ